MPKDWNNGLESEPVTTYVSVETKEAWKEHAENLDVSLSRFVEMMVNAGRSSYEETAPEGYETSDLASAKRRIKALEDRLDASEAHPEAHDAFEVYRTLDGDYARLDDVAGSLGADEAAVYEALQMLIDEGLVEYDAMRNAYRRVE